MARREAPHLREKVCRTAMAAPIGAPSPRFFEGEGREDGVSRAAKNREGGALAFLSFLRKRVSDQKKRAAKNTADGLLEWPRCGLLAANLLLLGRNGDTAMAEPLDDFIAAAAAALDLPLEVEWQGAIKANLEVTLKHANFVADFALPDEAEPAPIYKA